MAELQESVPRWDHTGQAFGHVRWRRKKDGALFDVVCSKLDGNFGRVQLKPADAQNLKRTNWLEADSLLRLYDPAEGDRKPRVEWSIERPWTLVVTPYGQAPILLDVPDEAATVAERIIAKLNEAEGTGCPGCNGTGQLTDGVTDCPQCTPRPPVHCGGCEGWVDFHICGDETNG